MIPVVSVLMPVFNGCERGKEAFLRAGIESVLDQTFENFEFVIVNDGSTDGTMKVLEEYAAKDSRIKLVTNPTNMRIAKALNIGLDHCSALLVARQDADDMSVATRLEIQLDFLANRPETALCGTGMYVIDAENRLLMEIYHPCNYVVVRQALKSGCPIVHGSVMFRKDVVKGLGGYASTPDVAIAEDYDLWVRMAAAGHVIENIPDKILYFHRNHATKSSSVHASTQAASTVNVIRKATGLIK